MINVFVGWDPRDDTAFRVCRDSLLAHASKEVQIVPLYDRELRRAKEYWRPYAVDEAGQMHDAKDMKPFSTQFSFTRFLVPSLEKYRTGLAVFVDPDFLWRADIFEMLNGIADKGEAVYCVKHNHAPREYTKMDGVLQTVYYRKNWSSLMVFRPERCTALTKFQVNSATGQWLHALHWTADDTIGTLPPAWNWLAGYDEHHANPPAVHFTLGTPDMPFRPETAFDTEWWAYARRYKDPGPPARMAARS